MTVDVGGLSALDVARLSPASLMNYAVHDFEMLPHTMVIDEAITNWAWGLGGAKRRLLVTTPPSVGKSTLSTVGTSAWLAGTFPGCTLLLSSYQELLSKGFSRRSQDVILSVGHELWGVELVPDRKSAVDWELTNGSHVWASGTTGGTTGRPLSFWMIDDPIADQKAAESPTFRDDQWNWWMSVARTRIRSVTKVLLILTRWHPDDIAGRLLDDPLEREEWDVLRIPALSEGEGDVLGRPEGESIWEEVWSKVELERLRAQDRRWFECLFQASPVVKEGDTIKAEWLVGDEYYFDGAVAHGPRTVTEDELPKDLELCCGWDEAATEGGRKDETVGCLVGRSRNLGLLYVLDLIHGRWSPGKRDRVMMETMVEMEQRWGEGKVLHYFQQDPGTAGKDRRLLRDRMVVVAEGRALEVMYREADGAVKPESYRIRCASDTASGTGSKERRVEGPSANAEDGMWRVLEGEWNKDFLEAMVRFPLSPDDIPDAWSWAWRKVSLQNSWVRRSLNLF